MTRRKLDPAFRDRESTAPHTQPRRPGSAVGEVGADVESESRVRRVQFGRAALALRAERLVDAAAVESLGTSGFFTRELLTPDEVREAHAEMECLAGTSALQPARVGRVAAHQTDIRSDRTGWLEDTAAAPIAVLLGAFDGLRVALNEHAWLGLRRTEVQLACYPGRGARYARHRDAFVGGEGRRVTAIVYLNPAWTPDDGGQLRMYLSGTEAGRAETSVDIEPIGGRCLVFLSETVEHEVLPAWAPRFAVTAWYSACD